MAGDNSRNCANCRHYVVTDVKRNYEMNGAGTCTQKIYGCEKWECEYEPRNPVLSIFEGTIKNGRGE